MVNTVLFDLDGTLLDTMPDIALALNHVRKGESLPPLPAATIRPHVSAGARAMLKIGFDVEEDHPQYNVFLERFLDAYALHLTQSTQPFHGMHDVLSHLDDNHITWGIVTNKPSRFTFDLLKALELDKRSACIVCGDTLAKRKPNPDQILHACDLLEKKPEEILYIGDTEVDVLASKSAGTKSLIALYGYAGLNENPHDWKADGYISEPIEIIEWLQHIQTI